ncbi:MAG: hypothetical protein ACR2NZ_05800, partial [Rubripirellula sp.]
MTTFVSNVVIASCLCLCVIPAFADEGTTAEGTTAGHSQLSFPSTAGDWETVEPDAVHWDKAKLAAALQWAGEVGSSGVVVLLDGKILAEGHWTQAGDGDLDGKRPDYSLLGTNDSGHSIEDVA